MQNNGKQHSKVLSLVSLLALTACGGDDGDGEKGAHGFGKGKDDAGDAEMCDYSFDITTAPYHNFKSWEEESVTLDKNGQAAYGSKPTTLKVTVISASRDRYEIKREGNSYEVTSEGASQVLERKEVVKTCMDALAKLDELPKQPDEPKPKKDRNERKEPSVEESKDNLEIGGVKYAVKKVTTKGENYNSIYYSMDIPLARSYNFYGKSLDSIPFTLKSESSYSSSSTYVRRISKLEKR